MVRAEPLDTIGPELARGAVKYLPLAPAKHVLESTHSGLNSFSSPAL